MSTTAQPRARARRRRAPPGVRGAPGRSASSRSVRPPFSDRLLGEAKRIAAASAAGGAPPQPSLLPSDTEEHCREVLESIRWPDGVRCPRCDARDGISRIAGRGQYECGNCRYQFSVRVGTVFQSSHLPLWKWFLAAYLIVASPKPLPGSRLQPALGISYKTAWYLTQRIRAATEDLPADARHPRSSLRLRELLEHMLGVESIPYAELVRSA